jgi:hypothetical protein
LIPVVAVVAGAATGVPIVLPYVLAERSWGWYLLVVSLSPGWLWHALVSHRDSSGFNWDDPPNASLAGFVYWFVWIFWFVRWRRQRAARLDA